MEIVIPVIIVGIIGFIAGLGLSLASKFMSVPTDEKQQKIRDALPGANCGACGYSGCDGYAAAVASGEASPDKCAPGGAASAAALAEILGTLTEREADVLKMRFGMYDGRTHTLEEVGQIFGVTRERIRQIENKAIRELRHPSRAKKIKDFYC